MKLTDEEVDEIIAEVRFSSRRTKTGQYFSLQIDTDKSDTIDFNEFVKIMT